MYKVFLTKSSLERLKKFPKSHCQAFEKSIEKLRANPFAGSPLVGQLKGLWKLRFSRYRIIYRIENQKLIIIVLEVRHRKDVYRL